MKKSLFYIFLTAFIAIFLLAELNAQDIKIQKQVIGSGGMVGTIAGDVKMSGIFGQTIIGKRNSLGAAGDVGPTVHQGFWVPLPSITSVDEPRFTFNPKISNYPNPVNSSTTFRYSLESNAIVTLRIIDMVGNQITVFRDEYQSAGEHNYQWFARGDNGLELSSGSYIYELIVQPAERTGYSGSGPYSLRNVMVIIK